jgi:hypothetical protein
MSTAEYRPTGHDFIDVALGCIRAREGATVAIEAGTQMVFSLAAIIGRERGHEHLHSILEEAAACAMAVDEDLGPRK